MFRNQYDSDVTTWSPDGRLHQVEYAMEAVKQGSAIVGLKSKSHAVLVALKRAPSELASYQKKIIPLDTHVGVSFAGLTADAKSLSRWMRSECLNARFRDDSALRLAVMINDLCSGMQLGTQGYNRRPYGVGLLVAGYDDKGPHIYQICPSANNYDCRAMAIGARSQSAKTYLERHLEEFAGSDLEALVAHGLRALRDTLPSEVELNTKNVSIAIVGSDRDFEIIEDDSVSPYLELIAGEQQGGGGGGEAAPEEGEEQQPAGMETD